MDKERLKFSLWYFAITMVIVLIVQSMIASVGTETLGYGDLKTLIKAGKVDNLVVSENEISGTIRNDDLDGILSKEIIADLQKMGQGDHRFVTIRVADPALVQDLEAAKIRFTGQFDSHWFSTVLSWVLPALIFVAIWTFAMKRMGGAGGMLEIGKSKAKVYMEKDTGVTFDDVAGIDEAKEELIEVVQFLKDPARYRRLGGKIPKGVLIVGSPGTGKTLLAKAVAGEAGVPFFSMSGSEFVEMFVGVGAARVRDLFGQAEERAPCIIFIDELDALGKARGVASFGGHEEREQTLNQLLVQMDGFDTNKGVIIMAATNRPEILDPALLRPGRFDRHVALDRPDLAGRRKILEVHAKNVKLSPAIDLAAIAARTSGFVGADLANLVNEAALLAARHDKKSVEMSDFDQALDRIVGGLEKKNRLMNAKEKETVSYHEAGHALVAEFRPNADRVSKISIIPRGVAALGYTQQTPTEDRYLLRRSELLDRLDVLLGGRVAEEIVFSDVSTGAQNDLQRATEMARQMVAQFGMSETLGLAAFEQPARAQYLDESMRQGSKDYSERTAQTIDEEVGKLLEESHMRVKRTLVEHRGTLNALAQLLLQTEVVDRAALDALLAESTPSAMKSVAPVPDPLPLSSAS